MQIIIGPVLGFSLFKTSINYGDEKKMTRHLSQSRGARREETRRTSQANTRNMEHGTRGLDKQYRTSDTGKTKA